MQNPLLEETGNWIIRGIFSKNIRVWTTREARSLCCNWAGLYLSPTFETENSNTSVILVEFWIDRARVAFNDLDANMGSIRGFIKMWSSYVLERIANEAAHEKR
jgi:hypothetical protein